jgi:hypothetical protein
MTVCASHTSKSKFERLGYVEKGIEAARRLKNGWKQRKCRYCGHLIWIDPTQARAEKEARKACRYCRAKLAYGRSGPCTCFWLSPA